MNRSLGLWLLCALTLALHACRREAPAAPPPLSPEAVQALVQQAEAEASKRTAPQPKCTNPRSIYDGSIAIDAKDYLHVVAKGDDFVDAPIENLDRVVTPATRVRFTLDYPFEKPFDGVVEGKVTLRRIIDSVRAGFRTMYEGAEVRDIPGMMNKDVKGKYGASFHAISDLVIEGIDLCDGDRLELSIGS